MRIVERKIVHNIFSSLEVLHVHLIIKKNVVYCIHIHFIQIDQKFQAKRIFYAGIKALSSKSVYLAETEQDKFFAFETLLMK